MPDSITVIILAGGPSREHEVSLASGKSIADALKEAGCKVKIADIDPNDLSALDEQADVFFPALHGAFGEDGTLQEIFEKRGLTFCGSDSHACKLTMNKYQTKLKMKELEIPTPRFDYVGSEDDIIPAKALWSMPVIIKPVTEGSSFGIYIVRDAEKLEEIIRNTLKQFGPLIIEDYIEGTELTVGILADKALPVIEIRTQREFYDYDAKYRDDDTEFILIEDSNSDFYRNIQQLSLQAAEGLGLRDFSRVDWMLDNDNNPFFLEANAIPGFTTHSLLPKAAKAGGYEMTDMCKMIVEMAMDRNTLKV